MHSAECAFSMSSRLNPTFRLCVCTCLWYHDHRISHCCFDSCSFNEYIIVAHPELDLKDHITTMGKRGKRRRRHGQTSDQSIDKRQKVDDSDGAGEADEDEAAAIEGVIQVSHHGQEAEYRIPPLLDMESNEKSDIQDLWGYLKNENNEWKPTPIQKQLWSILRLQKKKNVIGIAPTGSGKTMAYGIPTLLAQKSLLVLVPTRELCQQVSKVYLKLVKGLPDNTKRCKVVSIYGGVDKQAQKKELSQVQENMLILVATPGRLLDILQGDDHEDSPLSLSKLKLAWIVLDEADQLSKDGDLGPQVDQILERMQSPSTSLALVSATFPEIAKTKFEKWVKNDYILVQVNSQETSKTSYAKIPSHLKQVLHVCSDHKKPRKLMTTIQKIQKEHSGIRNAPLGIVFFARIERLKYVGKLLERDGISSVSLHSQLSTLERTQNLETFQCGKRPLLLATDVAARGIDIAAIQFVIQYDFPSNLQQYVHRCGRAGRSGGAGTVYSFFTRNLKQLAADMITLLESTNAWVDPNLRALAVVKKTEKGASNEKNTTSSCSKNDEESKMIEANRKFENGGQDEEFMELSPNRIVLKRASHVSDASSSSEGEEDD